MRRLRVACSGQTLCITREQIVIGVAGAGWRRQSPCELVWAITEHTQTAQTQRRNIAGANKDIK